MSRTVKEAPGPRRTPGRPGEQRLVMTGSKEPVIPRGEARGGVKQGQKHSRGRLLLLHWV